MKLKELFEDVQSKYAWVEQVKYSKGNLVCSKVGAVAYIKFPSNPFPKSVCKTKQVITKDFVKSDLTFQEWITNEKNNV